MRLSFVILWQVASVVEQVIDYVADFVFVVNIWVKVSCNDSGQVFAYMLFEFDVNDSYFSHLLSG